MRNFKEILIDGMFSALRIPFAYGYAAINGIKSADVADFRKESYGCKTFLRTKYEGVDVEVCFAETVPPFYLAAAMGTLAGAKEALVVVSMRDLRELIEGIGEERVRKVLPFIIAHEFGHVRQISKRVVQFFQYHESDADSKAIAECKLTGPEYHEAIDVLLTGLAYQCRNEGAGAKRYRELRKVVIARCHKAVRNTKRERITGRKADFEVIADLLIREAKRGGEKEAV